MKKMRKATGILLTAAVLLAAGNSARAQAIEEASQGFPYTIGSAAEASAVNPVTYQWYRDGSPIQGATGKTYTVPPEHAYGSAVKFWRTASTKDCNGPISKASNTVTVNFTGAIVMPVGCKLFIAGVCWADKNLDGYQVEASKPDQNTKFFQWNRATTPYSADDPCDPAWNATADQSMTWTTDPCPSGWRLPTMDEYQLLHDAGNTWVDAGTRGASIAGRFYGYNHTSCTLPTNMNGCVFFPASGSRNGTSGALSNRGANGSGWSSTQVSSTSGYNLPFNSTNSYPANNNSKAYGFPVRCVR